MLVYADRDSRRKFRSGRWQYLNAQKT